MTGGRNRPHDVAGSMGDPSGVNVATLPPNRSVSLRLHGNLIRVQQRTGRVPLLLTHDALLVANLACEIGYEGLRFLRDHGFDEQVRILARWGPKGDVTPVGAVDLSLDAPGLPERGQREFLQALQGSLEARWSPVVPGVTLRIAGEVRRVSGRQPAGASDGRSPGRAILAERGRIGQALQGSIIPSIYSTGLVLEAIAARAPNEALAEQIRGVVRRLDQTIDQLRRSLFAPGADGLPSVQI